MEEYLNSLSLEDLDYLEIALSPETTVNIRLQDTDSLEEHAAERLDEIIADAPKLSADTTIYRVYKSIPELQKGGTLEEPAFFAGSSTKPNVGDGELAIAVTAPAGTPALQLDDTTYVLDRGLKVELEATDQNYVLGSFGSFESIAFDAQIIMLSDEDLEDVTIPVTFAPTFDGIMTTNENLEDVSIHVSFQPIIDGLALEGAVPAGLEQGIIIPIAFTPFIEEFYNKVHDPKSGKFGEGGGDKSQGLGDGDGKAPGETNRHGGKTRDLGGRTIEGVKGWDERGKPIPGSDAWIEAHGISRKVFNERPYTKFEQDANDPAIAKEYGGYKPDHRLFQKVASQSSGWIMQRNAAPGTPNPERIPGQVRPDKKVVLDPGQAARKKTILENDKKRLAELQGFKPADVIRDREVRLAKAKENLAEVHKTTPDTIRKDAADKLVLAQKNFDSAKAKGSEEQQFQAKAELNRAKRAQVRGERIARTWRPDKEQYDAETAVTTAEKRLANAKADPQRAITSSVQAAERRVSRSENAYDKTAIKYTFPSQPGSASRLDVHQDAQNLKNLTQGKGRVYWAMEGCIKADSVLTSLKKEDPTAAVISNPSVTLWQNSESAWVARKYLHGREVVLLPDADGVKNADVIRQAKGLQALLQNNGVEKVYVASPPLKDGGIEHFKLRSGLDEERKGVDDHLGAGRGTLGQMTFTHQTVPHISLHEYTREGGAVGTEKINKNALGSTEAVMTAVSSIAGSKGVAKIPKNMLAQASGQPRTNVADARARLEKLGLIKVEYVFDPDALARGKRVQVMSDERINQLVRAKVIKQPRVEEKFTGIEFDESPVISVLHDKHKSVDAPGASLSSLPSWKPPKSYKGWTSPVLGSKTGATPVKVTPRKKITAGGLLSTALVAEDVLERSSTGSITVEHRPESPASSEVTIKDRSEVPLLNTTMLIDAGAAVEEFYNRSHDRRTGKFAPNLAGQKVASSTATPTEGSLLDKAHGATKRRALSGGRSGASVELLNGRKGRVIRKSGLTKDDVDREYLTARVGKALGAPVPTVARVNNSAIVVQYVSGNVAGTFHRDIGRILPLDEKARKASVGLKGSRELALLDIATKNEDRHGGNFLVRPDGKSIVGIDHTTTFGGKAFLGLRPSKALENHWKSSFTKSDYSGALKKIKPLKRDFKKLGREDWYLGMEARLTDAASKAKE